MIRPHALGIGDPCTHSMAGQPRRPQDATERPSVKRGTRGFARIRARIRPSAGDVPCLDTWWKRTTPRDGSRGAGVVDVADRQRLRRRPV